MHQVLDGMGTGPLNQRSPARKGLSRASHGAAFGIRIRDESVAGVGDGDVVEGHSPWALWVAETTISASCPTELRIRP